MSQGLLSALSSWLSLDFSFSRFGACLGTEPEVFYCVDCCLERGYRWPVNGHVNEKLATCDACAKRSVVFDIGDLYRADEVQEIE